MVRVSTGLPRWPLMALAILGGAAARTAVPAAVTPTAGTIRIWASPADGRLVEGLEAGFRRSHPAVRFANTLHGPESTFASVNMDVADIAFMGRELRVPLETMAFEWEHHYAPFEIEIANAGLGARHGPIHPGVNLAFFVNRRNPLTCLTLRQADDVFAADHRRGGANVRSWGELGLARGWAARPVHVYGPPLAGFAAVFIRERVLGRSRKWNARYHAVSGGWRPLLDAVARDPDGITYAPPVPGHAGVKALRLAAHAGGACVSLDARTAVARTYPLVRTIDVALDRRPGTALPPAVEVFLRYVLGREGQRVIARDRTYLPLSKASVQAQMQRLR